MTNLKKLLAVIIVVAMMATLGLPALAAEMTDAEICKTIGILKGSGTGVDADYLAADTTRLQAVILTLRFMGKEADALAYEGTDSFSDAADVWWAGGQKILAYLKANPDLGWIGYTDGTFKPTSVASAKMIYKVLLVALGYVEGVDFTWANVLSFAASKGLFKVADKDMMSN
ncbi:MAG: esterase, partial [Clostridiales bacterium]|nr:esterase [Clostridiales bacterium]